jgi:hypothetical protein
MRKARSEVKGLPAGFRYHDYSASLLTAYLTEQRRNSATARP